MALTLAIFIVSLAVSAQAANLNDVSDAMSSHAASATGVTHTIKFRPATAITAPGDVKIIWAAGYDLSNVIASADVTVSGGGATWAAPVNGDLIVASRTLTLNWASGTLSSAGLVTITVNFVKNPPSAGNYDLTIQVGPDGFSTATDAQTVPTVIANTGVAVSAAVAYPEANPTVSNITPVETIIVSSGATQIISFDIADANNNSVDYTVTPSTGAISVSPSPVSPATGTSAAKTITFTYFANGATGSQTITVTADDNEATGGALVTYNIQLFVI